MLVIVKKMEVESVNFLHQYTVQINSMLELYLTLCLLRTTGRSWSPSSYWASFKKKNREESIEKKYWLCDFFSVIVSNFIKILAAPFQGSLWCKTSNESAVTKIAFASDCV